MRSRYSAYVLGDEAYLHRTWVAEYRPSSLFDNETPQWIGLNIVRTDDGKIGDATGIVEFIARYKINGRAYRLHELSEFVCVNGRWMYVKGITAD